PSSYLTGLLRLRLGDAAPLGGFSCDLPRQRPHGADRVAELGVSLAALSRDVRRRPDQATRRSLLAQLHLPGLLLRDAADAEPAQLVLSLAAPFDPPRRGPLQSCGGARRAVRVFRAAADRVDRR